MKKTAWTLALMITSLLTAEGFAEPHLQGSATCTRMQQVTEGHYLEALEKLSHTYNMLADMLDQVGIAKLDDAQAAWQKYSKADCKFSTDYARGEALEQSIYQDCLTNMTEERTAALDYQLRRNFTLDPTMALSKQKK